MRAIKEHLKIEQHLEIFSFNSENDINPEFAFHKEKRWAYNLPFSLYQEASDYVKLQEQKDIDFNAKVSTMRENSHKSYNDIILCAPKLESFKLRSKTKQIIQKELRKSVTTMQEEHIKSVTAMQEELKKSVTAIQNDIRQLMQLQMTQSDEQKAEDLKKQKQ